jgi:5-methyltetrahydrofolate--homocysteine methyltransferase
MIILGEGREAMEIVGQKFENKEFFLPDLLISGEILKDIKEILKFLFSHK